MRVFTRSIARIVARKISPHKPFFERAGDARKVLCVALDYAKRKHLALLSRRARVTGEPADVNPAYRHLRDLTRCRRTLVRQQTAASNRIHVLAEELFPGFLNGSKSALTPFTEAFLELMGDRFSAPQIARRKPAALANLLCRHAFTSLMKPRRKSSCSPATQGHASPRCNRILKDWTVQSAQKITEMNRKFFPPASDSNGANAFQV